MCNLSYEIAVKGLILAFVERWHHDTDNFYLVVGEMPITLDDGSALFHLPVVGQSICM